MGILNKLANLHSSEVKSEIVDKKLDKQKNQRIVKSEISFFYIHIMGTFNNIWNRKYMLRPMAHCSDGC
jgi:hypothetical protein